MIHILVRQFEKRKLWRKLNHALMDVRDMASFDRFVQQYRPKDFLFYMAASEGKRKEFRHVVVDILGVQLRGKRFLDIGPGYGDSLDVAHEEGADVVEYVEYDPIFYKYNLLKGFTKGYRINHLRRLGTISQKYDFIWIRGAFPADFMIRCWWYARPARWARQVKAMGLPGATIVVCPYWETVQQHRRIQNVENNRFTKAMLGAGFQVRRIESHNGEPNFPITFIQTIGANT
jgi:hypothetical protein